MFKGLRNKWNRFMNNDELKRKIYMVVYDTDTQKGKILTS